MSDVRRQEGEPFDRLTRLAAEMTDVLEAKGSEVEDVKCIVFLDDRDRGGIHLHGYEDDMEAMADLFLHMKAVFEANGKQLAFAPMPGMG
jgi:hypothetical protein